MGIPHELFNYEYSNRQRNFSLVAYLLVIIVYFSHINIIFAHRSSPDIGLCETIINNTFTSLECLRGQENFCCNTELLTTIDNVTKWAKKCCTETEFVLQNA